jgi:hypothetical protein
MTTYISEQSWLDEPKPWRREMCLLCYVHRSIAPRNKEMSEMSGRPRRTIEDWKKFDEWVRQRREVKGVPISRAVVSEVSRDVSTAIAYVQGRAVGCVVDDDDDEDSLGLEERAARAKKRHIKASRKMFRLADAFFDCATHVVGAEQAGRIPNPNIVGGINAFMSLTGKGSPMSIATTLALSAIAAEREALGITLLESGDEMRKLLNARGYDIVKILPDGGLERLADEP